MLIFKRESLNDNPGIQQRKNTGISIQKEKSIEHHGRFAVKNLRQEYQSPLFQKQSLRGLSKMNTKSPQTMMKIVSFS